MSKIKSEWLPMSDLATSDQISWNLNNYLPEYVSPDDMLVNPGHLSRLALWGSFEAGVTVTGEKIVNPRRQKNTEGTKSDAPPIAGINSDGTAAASFGLRLPKDPTMGGFNVESHIDNDSGEQTDPESLILSCCRAPLTLSVDTNKIETYLSGQHRLHDSSAWAECIDTALRKQTVNATRHHIIGGMMSKVIFSGKSSVLAMCAMPFSATFETPYIGQYLAFEGLFSTLNLIKKVQCRKDLNKCFSLTWPQVDRIPAVAALSKLPMSRIVKPV